MKFRKKPVVIEACQYIGEAEFRAPMPEWMEAALKGGTLYFDPDGLMIKTLEGPMRASIGGYIIQGVNGELYACEPDIFEKTYEPLED